MKQALISLVRHPLRLASRPAASLAQVRELDRSELRQVVGGASSQSPRTGW